MTGADIESAIVLLAKGFPERSADYWRQAFERLRLRLVPDGFSPYGWVMADGNKLVGIILVVFSATEGNGVRGNVSSWYVEPAYRTYSHMLLAAPLKIKHATLFNISPAPATIGTIEAQGFVRYVDGTFICAPALSPKVRGASVRRVRTTDDTSWPLLHDHATWGCLALEVTHNGQTYPFVFVERRFIGGLVPCVQLTYCRDLDDFLHFAGVIGRHLMRSHIFAVLVDAKASIPGLTGIFRAGRSPKYYRGASAPRHGDLSYTELAIFGS